MSAYDFFISHANADKEKYVAPLATALASKGATFWLDSLEIGWGDNLSLKVNEGLRESKIVLLCLSKNFLKRPWPETELGAALAIQNSSGAKRVLPLILNSKATVLSRYPILAGLVYREFREGVERLAEELAGLIKVPNSKERRLNITIESVHTGQRCQLTIEPRVSIRWLSDRAQAELGVSRQADTGAYEPFMVRWVLVDARAEEIWRSFDRDTQRRLHALIRSDQGLRFCLSDRDLVEDLEVYDGIIFHLYAVEDDGELPPAAKSGF